MHSPDLSRLQITIANYLSTQRSNKYLKLTCPKSNSRFILHSSQKSAPLILLPSSVSGRAILPKSWGNPASSLSYTSSNPSENRVNTTSTVIQANTIPHQDYSNSLLQHFCAPGLVLSACQISAQRWWTAPFILSVFPLQGHFGVLVFCSTIAAGSL